MLEVGNTATSTTLTANSTIPFDKVFFNTNSRTSFNSTTNEMVIKKVGIYKVGGSFTFAPTTAGSVTVTMYVNGVAQPTAVSTIKTTADAQTVTFVIPSKYLDIIPSNQNTTVPIKFVVSAAGVLSNANAFVYYNEGING